MRERGGLTLQTPINITSATCGSTSRTVFCISSNKIGFILKNVSGIEVRWYFMAVTLIFNSFILFTCFFHINDNIYPEVVIVIILMDSFTQILAC